MNKNIMRYKGYYAKIEYSDEDECFCGQIEGLKKDVILFEGQKTISFADCFSSKYKVHFVPFVVNGLIFNCPVALS